MTDHPDLAAEQAYIEFAYACLQRSREDAWRLRELTEVGRGGTMQARYERDVFEEAMYQRLSQLDLHDAALVFGRIDRHGDGPDHHAGGNGQSAGAASGSGAGPAGEGAEGAPATGPAGRLAAASGPSGDVSSGGGVESFHIGRLAISDEQREPVVIDWRAPVAEPFYRATGRDSMGLVRRRHFAVKGRQLLAIEDELFGEGHLGVGDEPTGLRGYSTLIAALERSRTGRLGDIVATIQAEQDEIIRSPQSGVLVVQGGPGTGKTVVALHRAAYLLYTFRFPLEDQGVLVVGPNRVFLRYIERVLPSLGEAGVEEVVLADLVPDVDITGTERPAAARVKGDPAMAAVMAKAVRDRQRPLKADVVVPYGITSLRLRASDTERIVQSARRRFRRHNAARRYVEQEVFAAFASSARMELTTEAVRDRIRGLDEVREALERIWPVLTPAQLLYDLLGSRALLKLAGSRYLKEAQVAELHRPRVGDVHAVEWTDADVALLDEARALLGPKPGRAAKSAEDEEIRTYGHIVIDEVQDLTPMQLRMVSRRSLNGSMTIVGDLAQATGPHAPHDWSDVLDHLPDRRPPRIAELTVGYRIPAQAMELAARVLRVAAPALAAPVSVREGEAPPDIVRTTPDGLGAEVAAAVRRAADQVGDGGVAVVSPSSLLATVGAGLGAAGISYGRVLNQGIDEPVTLVPVGLVKGLELDAVIVVEPARIVAEENQGLRALYVALTRATRRLSVVHAEALPEALL